MKQNYILLGDIHLNENCNSRKDNYKDTLFRKLRWVYKTANKLRAPIIFAGDMLDVKPNEPNTPTSVFLQFVHLTQNNLKEEFIIPSIGNHDVQSNVDNWENERIAWLNHVKGFTLSPHTRLQALPPNLIHHPSKSEHCDIESIYGISYKKKIDNSYEILVTHDDWWPEDVSIGDKKITNKYKLSAGIKEPIIWLNGHMHIGHDPFKLGSTICVNPGSVMRTRRDGLDDKRKPAIAIIQFEDGKLIKCKYITIPHESRETVFKEKKYVPAIDKQEWYEDFINKLKESKHNIKGAMKPDAMIYKMYKKGTIEKDLAKKSIQILRNEEADTIPA